MRFLQTTAMALAACLALPGCTVFSPVPLWELVKATGSLAASAGQSQRGEASHTVVHDHEPFTQVCIAFDPRTQVPDVLPALQAAFDGHGIESRVYDGPAPWAQCPVWLRYSTQMQWGQRGLSDQPQPYLSAAALTLQSAHGKVLASSQYVLETGGRSSQWASTRDKLNAAVAALVQRSAPTPTQLNASI